MAKFDDKVNGNTVDASEYNNIVRSPKNTITSAGIPISSDNDQLAKAVANYSAVSDFYSDSGAANAYVLTPINSFKAPTEYIDGMLVRFRAGNASTTASTVNVAGLGVKNIKLADGTTDISNEIVTTTDSYLRYDLANDAMIFIDTSSNDATISTKGVSFLNQKIVIANNSVDSDHDIDFGEGIFNFSDGSGQARASALTKQIDASWVAGNNTGGLFSGTVAASTTYHCFAITNPTTGNVDFGFDTDVNAANAPSGYTKHQRVGSLLTDGSANIFGFKMKFISSTSAEFLYNGNIIDFAGFPPITSSNTDLVLSLPTGINIGALLHGGIGHAGAAMLYLLKSKIEGDFRNVGGIGNVSQDRDAFSAPPILTDTSATIIHGYDSGLGNASVTLNTAGWLDYKL